jgi:3'(2'), 5'-bisphosphate nucleotidase
MPERYEKELEVALECVRDAAALCQSVQSAITPDVLDKKDRSPVTVADFGSQALICLSLHESFPADPIVAEEDSADLRKPDNRAILDRVVERVSVHRSGADGRKICDWIDRGGSREFTSRFWTLDPIDGTKGFLRGEQYAVALSLVVDGELAVGVLGCPNLPYGQSGGGTIFCAVRDRGARAMAMDAPAGLESLEPIRVSGQSDPARARFCESVESGHSSHNDAALIAQQLGITQSPLRMDSQAKYGVVARGEAEIYLRMPTRADYQEKIWDHAAGALIVTESGGRVTDIHGKPLEFFHGSELAANRGVIVSNGLWHDRLLAAVSSAR